MAPAAWLAPLPARVTSVSSVMLPSPLQAETLGQAHPDPPIGKQPCRPAWPSPPAALLAAWVMTWILILTSGFSCVIASAAGSYF